MVCTHHGDANRVEIIPQGSSMFRSSAIVSSTCDGLVVASVPLANWKNQFGFVERSWTDIVTGITSDDADGHLIFL
jgi:hypothetical protein